MPEFLKRFLVRALKVPEQPVPPEGKDLKTFLAAPNYFKYSLLGWAASCLVTLIFLGITALVAVHAVTSENGFSVEGWITIIIFGGAGVAAAVSQLLKFLTLRLDYEYRWYMITDSGLRIREGIVTIHEITMAFRNIQNVTITQGPVQRLLGISDLVVQTAGGAMGVPQGGQQQGVVSSHVGYFRGVANAEEIRDTIMTRLRKVKGAGLDRDEEEEEPATHSGLSTPSIEALKRAAGEAHLLRKALNS